jgi:hypothetical protein
MCVACEDTEGKEMLADAERYRIRFEPFRKHLESKEFEYLSRGGFRDTFRRKNIVIKIPRKKDGEIDNMVEAAGWRKYKNNPTDLGFHLAPCRILENGCLMMVYASSGMPHEKWVESLHDGWQIGGYKGRVVVYDYALELSERAQWEEEWGLKSRFFQKEWLPFKPRLQKKVA